MGWKERAYIYYSSTEGPLGTCFTWSEACCDEQVSKEGHAVFLSISGWLSQRRKIASVPGVSVSRTTAPCLCEGGWVTDTWSQSGSSKGMVVTGPSGRAQAASFAVSLLGQPAQPLSGGLGTQGAEAVHSLRLCLSAAAVSARRSRTDTSLFLLLASSS